MSTTAIIPTINDEASIGTVVLKTRKYVDHVIVVDDGSTDNTVEIARLAGADVIRNDKDRGKSNAIKTGFHAACQNGTKIVVAIDTNSKRYIDIIPETIDHIKNNGYDIVVSSWYDDKKSGNGNHKGNSKGNSNDNSNDEGVVLNETAYNKNEGFLAFSIEPLSGHSLRRIDLAQLNGSPIRDMLYNAEKNKLKIKYVTLEKRKIPNQFSDYNIGVVVPAYNEELLIKETISGIPSYVKRIYIIDDGSTDRTPEIIKEVNDPRVLFIRHENNRGVGAAIITGYKLALEDNMDIVAVMAGDNQMDPDQLHRLIKPIIDGQTDYTKGNRLGSKDLRKGMSNWRFFGNTILTMITKVGSGYWHIMDPQNGYTAISRKTLERIDVDSIYTYYGYCNDILIKLNTFGMRVEDVTIPARYGQERSKIKYGKYIVKVAPMIFRGFLWRLKTKYVVMDFHPLVFFYMMGVILLSSGGLFSFVILYQKLFHGIVSFNISLLAIFTIIMGLQFLLFAMFFDMQADKNKRTEMV